MMWSLCSIARPCLVSCPERICLWTTSTLCPQNPGTHSRYLTDHLTSWKPWCSNFVAQDLFRKCAASSFQLNVIQVLMRKKEKWFEKVSKYTMIKCTIQLNSCLYILTWGLYFNATVLLVRRVWQTNSMASCKSDQLCCVNGHNSEMLLIYAKKRDKP